MMQVSEAVRLTPAPPEAIRVECIDTAWGLTALRPQWNELLRASAADGPFLTWEWLHSWWTHLHGAAALKVVAVRDGNDLIAIAPLMVTPGAVPWTAIRLLMRILHPLRGIGRSRIAVLGARSAPRDTGNQPRALRDIEGRARGWFSRLEFLGSGHAGSDYLDVIVRIGRETEALRAIAGFLETQKMTLRLDHLPERSFGGQLAERLASERWVASVAPGGVCPIIPLAGHTWDSYLATLGSAHRANVRRRLRAASQQFQMRFEQVTSEPQRRAALEALGGFHERRFRTDGGSTAFLTPALRAFQDDATRRALDRGWLRMYVLWLNDVPAAVMYGFFYHRQFYFYQHGFDDRYARHSVGLVLMALTIRAAIDEGAQAFDLLWGTEPYKWLWTRETQTLRQIHLFPPNAAGRIHRRAVETRRRLGRLTRRLRSPGEVRGPSA